jgi:serine protease Do
VVARDVVASGPGGPRGLALVPADAVIAVAERLVRDGEKPAGRLGVDVQALTPGIAAATGADAGVAGVVVTWVHPKGPAARALRTADIIEAIDNQPVATLEHWNARVAAVAEGDSLLVRVRRAGTIAEVPLTAASPADPPVRPLGLTLRTIPRTGAEVVSVAPLSAAALAGLAPGAVLTRVGEIEAPTAAQVSRAFAGAARDRPILVAFTRAGTHRVIALERTW